MPFLTNTYFGISARQEYTIRALAAPLAWESTSKRVRVSGPLKKREGPGAGPHRPHQYPWRFQISRSWVAVSSHGCNADGRDPAGRATLWFGRPPTRQPCGQGVFML